jgi:uncharacterized protein YunC (DUF1805 family)
MLITLTDGNKLTLIDYSTGVVCATLALEDAEGTLSIACVKQGVAVLRELGSSRVVFVSFSTSVEETVFTFLYEISVPKANFDVVAVKKGVKSSDYTLSAVILNAGQVYTCVINLVRLFTHIQKRAKGQRRPSAKISEQQLLQAKLSELQDKAQEAAEAKVCEQLDTIEAYFEGHIHESIAA